MEISVIIPAYNEVERLPPTLRTIEAYLAAHFGSWEVIVADDGSTDGSIEQLQAQFPQVRFSAAPRNQGKGAAVRRAMLEAEGELRLFTDADLSTPIEELGPMVEKVRREGYTVAIASRGLRESRLEIRQPWWREISGRIFNLIVQPLSGLPYRDTQCGFKLFRCEAARDVFALTRCSGWAFDVEALMIAAMLGYRVAEMPVRWINAEGSKINLAADAPRMIRDVVQFRWRMFAGVYQSAWAAQAGTAVAK